MQRFFGLVFLVLASLCHADVRRVSESATGFEANGESHYLSISGNGRYVAFSSEASNLVAGTGGQARFRDQLYLKDLNTGEIELISIKDGRMAGSVGQSAMSSDGSFVAFTAWDTMWDPDDRGGQIYVKDRSSGLLSLVSRNNQGVPGNDGCMQPAMSRNGRFVAYASRSTNMGWYVSAVTIILHDRATGITERISPYFFNNAQVQDCHRPSTSDDGRFVVYEAYFGPPISSTRLVLLLDRWSGETSVVSRWSDGTLLYESCNATISGDGTKVAFEVYGGVSLPGLSRGLRASVFVRNLLTGEFEWINQADSGPDNPVRFYPSLSHDGNFVAFIDPRPLVPSDTNGIEDVYLRDIAAERTIRVSEGPLGEPNDWPFHTAIADDGSAVAFTSRASNLVPFDLNGVADIFVGPVLK